MDKNKKNQNSLIPIIVGMALIAFTPLGIFIVIFWFVYCAMKADKSGNTAEKKTDYSGMSKDMLKSGGHEHSYDKEGTDFCGVSGKLAENTLHSHDYSIHENDYCGMDDDMILNVTPKPKKPSKGKFDNKADDRIYNELINRKTDYSGVDPNILRRG